MVAPPAFLLLAAIQVGGAWQPDGGWTGAIGGDRFGDAVVVTGDLNGDGVDDLLVGAKYADTPTLHDAGSVTAYSGVDRSQLWSYFGSGDEEQLGYRLISIGDLDSDGVADVLVSSFNEAPLRTFYEGRVTALSGSDGSLLHELDGSVYNEKIGSSLAEIGDRDGDGVPDYATGSPGYGIGGGAAIGRVQLVSGATGLPFTEWLGPFYGARIGGSLAFVGDTDLDGGDELAVGLPEAPQGASPGFGKVIIVDLGSGAPVRTIANVNGWEYTGRTLTTFPDVTGDGVGELLVSSLSRDLPGESRLGNVRLVELAGGQTLWSVDGYAEECHFGASMAVCPDIDADGLPDVVVGASALNPYLAPVAPAILILSAADGSILHRIDGVFGTLLGSAVAAHTDLDGDGLVKILAGASRGSAYGTVDVHSYDPFLHASQTQVSTSGAVNLVFEVDFPSSEGGLGYYLYASASGAGSTTWQGVEIPLTLDPLLQRFMAGWTPNGAVGIRGTLDSVGDATAVLPMTTGAAALAGQTLHFAAVSYLTYNVVPHLSTAAVPVELLP